MKRKENIRKSGDGRRKTEVRSWKQEVRRLETAIQQCRIASMDVDFNFPQLKQTAEDRVQSSKFKVQRTWNPERGICNLEPATIKRNSTVYYNEIPLGGNFQGWQLATAGSAFNN